MNCALAARGGGGGGGGGAKDVAAASVASLAFVAACWSDTGGSARPAKLTAGSSALMLSCVGNSCCAGLARSASGCTAATAVGNSSLEMLGEGASLSWLPASMALLGAAEALVTPGSAPPTASPFCDEAEAKGEVGIEPSLACPFV